MPTSQPLMRTLIIDDEQHARHYLRELLGGEKDVVVLGEASSGTEGLEQIRALSPSVITLKPAIRYQFKTGQRDWPKT